MADKPLATAAGERRHSNPESLRLRSLLPATAMPARGRRTFVLLVSLSVAGCGTAPIAVTAPAPLQGAPESRPVPAPTSTAEPALRLPSHVAPVRYALDLRVLPAEGSFDGTIDIELDVREPTATLWLNARELEIGGATLTRGQEVIEAPAEPVGDHLLRLDLPEAVPAGPARLRVRFAGTMGDERTQGIYRVQEPDGHWYAYTVFEPIDARRAFPHFDQPEFKVPWQLTLRVPEGHTALANSPVVERTATGDGLVKVVTAESRPMPSYLVAFVVGPFEVVDAGTAGRHGTPLRFVIPQRRSEELGYARDSTPRLVGLLEDYFGARLPYRKLDVAVVPRFWGTMEHPGLLAMGQPLTLIRPEEDSPDRRQSYANIAIHELCHYWFGDYVTLRWWDDTWLNEAFGMWCDQKITHRMEPSWEWDVRRVWWRNRALSADSLATAKAVREAPETVEEIETVFDNAITYGKGSTLLGMFEEYVGEERFREAVRAYLEEHAWGTATTESLTAVMDRELDGLGSAMLTFVEKPGAPLVTVDLACDGDPSVTLRQERYVPLGSTLEAAGRWSVPVCARFGGEGWEASECWLLAESEKSFAVAGATSCPAWLIANRGGAGYYRVRHGSGLGDTLAATLDQASSSERTAMISDLRALVTAGLTEPERALALVPELAGETDDKLVLFATGIVASMDELVPDELRPRYARFVRETFAARARELGWSPRPDESGDDRELRPELLETVARYGGDRELVAEAVERARRYAAGDHDLSDDMVGPVLRIAALSDDPDLFATLLEAARASDDRRRRARLFGALGWFPGEEHARRALEVTLDPELDLRDTRDILMGVARPDELDDLFWSFIQEHFDELVPRMDHVYLPWYLVGAAAWTCDPEREAELRAFYAGRVGAYDGAEAALEEGLESIRLCAASRDFQRPGVDRFLRALPTG
jgi:aminopeptidase N